MEHFYCFKQENQIVLLLNETSTTSDSSENACMMIVEANNLPFVSVDRSSTLNSWKLHDLKVNLIDIDILSFISCANQLIFLDINNNKQT